MKIFYGWVIVAAGIVMTCVGIGSMLSLGVFLQPMSEAMGWSRSGISLAAMLNFLCMGVGSFFWGALSDRFGTRVVVLSGGILLGAGLVAASRAATLGQFQLLFGIIVGVAAGSFYAPMTATTTRWFVEHRSLAVALVSAGLGLGSMTVAPLAGWIITNYDWRVAMLVIGDLAWLLLIPAALLVRNPPAAAPAAARRPARSRRGSSRWRRPCAPRSSRPSRSPTSRAARRTRARSSTWSPTRSTTASPRWPRPPC